MIEKVNINTESTLMPDFWKLRNIGQFNDHEVNIIKLKGVFEWHVHEEEDKLFFLIDGELDIQFKHQPIVSLKKNEFLVIPKGVEMMPVAKNEATIMIFEPQRKD